MIVQPVTPDGIIGRAVLGVLMWRGLGQIAYENGNMTPEVIRSQLQPTREEIAAETMDAIRQEQLATWTKHTWVHRKANAIAEQVICARKEKAP